MDAADKLERCPWCGGNVRMSRDEKGNFTVVCVGMAGDAQPCSWKMEGEVARDALRAAEREAV